MTHAKLLDESENLELVFRDGLGFNSANSWNRHKGRFRVLVSRTVVNVAPSCLGLNLERYIISLLLATMLLYPLPAPLSIVRTNQTVSVLLHSNLLTVAPPYQKVTSGASPATQELEASSLQGRLDKQNQLFKEQAASDAAPSPGEKKSLLGNFSLAASARQDAINRGAAPGSPPSLQMDFLFSGCAQQ